MKKVLLEICCGSAEDAVEAWKAGADRAELCSNLFHGGLTPSLGSLRVVKNETDIKAVAMVRPREGGFCYTDVDFPQALVLASFINLTFRTEPMPLLQSILNDGIKMYNSSSLI